MLDELYKYFGGKALYSKEEWELLTQKVYDLIEVDEELCDTKVVASNATYACAVSSLFRYGLKDFDFSLELREVETGRLLAKKTWSDRAEGGKISVVGGAL